MEYVGLLINQIGRRTRNRRDLVTSTAGISDDDILQALNDAQLRLQSVILQQLPHCTYFDARTTASLAAGTQAYSLPENAYLGGSIRKVEYKDTSLDEDYSTLQFMRSMDDVGDESLTLPWAYTLDGTQIRLVGVPASSLGTLRFRYPKRLDQLDIRRGKVLSVEPSGINYTSITLDNGSVIDAEAIESYVGDYLCVVGATGTVKYYNILIGSWSPDTITFSGTYPNTSGTIAPGDYIVLGRYKTTHSALPVECKKYLLAYAQSDLYEADADDRAIAQKIKLAAIEDELVGLFANLYLGKEIPIIHESQWFED